MKAVGSTPANPTFNRAAFTDVAKILLGQSQPPGSEPIDSTVGVVKDPSGKFVDSGGGRHPASHPRRRRSHAITGARPVSSDQPRRRQPLSVSSPPVIRPHLIPHDTHLTKRHTRPIPGTPYLSTITKGAIYLASTTSPTWPNTPSTPSSCTPSTKPTPP
ncbi:hypothetical protein MMC16_006311 [Acarospora aff. strigata]|nr:hypothetical protein [Acarospora aff. strigata]